MAIPKVVHLTDVGPRDGLQNEKQTIPASVKIELVHRLQDAEPVALGVAGETEEANGVLAHLRLDPPRPHPPFAAKPQHVR